MNKNQNAIQSRFGSNITKISSNIQLKSKNRNKLKDIAGMTIYKRINVYCNV